MNADRWVHVFAGTFVLVSLAQSGFTRFCLLEKILLRLGVKPA